MYFSFIFRHLNPVCDTAPEMILAYFFRGEPDQNRRAQSRKAAEKGDKSLNSFFYRDAGENAVSKSKAGFWF